MPLTANKNKLKDLRRNLPRIVNQGSYYSTSDILYKDLAFRKKFLNWERWKEGEDEDNNWHQGG